MSLLGHFSLIRFQRVTNGDHRDEQRQRGERGGFEPINDWSPGLTGRRLRRITTKSATPC
jgi:hypothetical protein